MESPAVPARPVPLRVYSSLPPGAWWEFRLAAGDEIAALCREGGWEPFGGSVLPVGAVEGLVGQERIQLQAFVMLRRVVGPATH